MDVLVFLQEEEMKLARNAEMVHHPWAGREEIWGGALSDEDDDSYFVLVRFVYELMMSPGRDECLLG